MRKNLLLPVLILTVTASVIGASSRQGTKLQALAPDGKQDACGLRDISVYQAKPTYFDLRDESRGEVSTPFASPGGQTSGSSQKVKSSTMLTGTLVVEPLAAQGRWTIRLVSPKVAVTVNGRSSVDERRIEHELSQGVEVLQDGQGQMRAFAIDAEADVLTRNLLRSVIEKLQIPHVPSSCALQWTAVGDDLNGRFTASYALKGANHQWLVTGLKLKYLSSPNVDLSQPDQALLPGGTTLTTFLESGELVAVNSTETTDMTIQGRSTGTSRTVLTLHQSAASAALHLASSAKRVPPLRTKTFTLDTTAERDESNVERLRADLGQVSAEELASAARHLDQPDAGTQGITVGRLVNLVYAFDLVHPEAVKSLVDLVKHEAPSSHAFNLLVGTLGIAGNAAAQAALVDLAQELHGSADAIKVIAYTAGRVERPQIPLIQMLSDLVTDESLAGDVRHISTLALGAMAAQVKSANTAVAQRLESLIVDSDQPRPGGAWSTQTLAALGNAASDRLYPLLDQLPKSQDAGWRRDVLWASTKLVASRSEPVVTAALASDPDDSVRYASATILSQKAASTDALLQQAKRFAVEPNEAVRLVLLRNLWRGRAISIEAMTAVRSAGESDPSGEVRKEANQYLSTIE